MCQVGVTLMCAASVLPKYDLENRQKLWPYHFFIKHNIHVSHASLKVLSYYWGTTGISPWTPRLLGLHH